MSGRRSKRRRIVERLGMVALVGVVAVVFLSSSLLAGVIALVTVTAVVIDSFELSRVEQDDLVRPDATPVQITVDLSRRS